MVVSSWGNRFFSETFGLLRGSETSRAILTNETENGIFLNICLHIPIASRSGEGQRGQGAWGVVTPTG